MEMKTVNVNENVNENETVLNAFPWQASASSHPFPGVSAISATPTTIATTSS